MGPTGAINTKVRVNFSNERSRSTPLDPKLMFWCVPFLFGCIWNHFATARNLLQKRQTGAINTKVRAMVSC